MKLIDKQYLDTPCFGVGQFPHWLRSLGYEINPEKIRRPLQLMG